MTDLSPDAQRRLSYRLRHSGKRCPKCRRDLPLSAFGSDVSRPDGTAYACRDCRRKQ